MMSGAFGVFVALQSLTAAPGLLWEGTAVHPGCLRELSADLADPKPVVAAIDLEGCRRSNKYSSSYETEGHVLRWADPEDDGRGYFEYEYLGVLSNGVHVVRIGESGGGSGIFQQLLFLRTVEATVSEDGRQRERHALTLVGSETLADRAQVTVELSGDTVTIRRREFRGEHGFGPEEVVVRTVR